MADEKWVDSAIEIPNIEKYYNFSDEIVLADYDGSTISQIQLPKGKSVSELTKNDVCIENGYVMPKDKNVMFFYIEGNEEVHSIECTSVRNLPGVYYVDDVVADKSNLFASERNESYFMAVDARMMARALEIPQSELVVTQQTCVDKDGNILDTRSFEKPEFEFLPLHKQGASMDEEVKLAQYRDGKATYLVGVPTKDGAYESIAKISVSVKNTKEVFPVKKNLVAMLDKNHWLRHYLFKAREATRNMMLYKDVFDSTLSTSDLHMKPEEKQKPRLSLRHKTDILENNQDEGRN